MTLDIKHTPVFTRNFEAFKQDGIRYIVNQGGSRSSKTYSILQLLIILCLTQEKTTISVVRQTLPALKGSAVKDLIEILREMNLYSKQSHHKTENRFSFPNGSTIEWFATVDEQKLRGRRRTHLYINEGNEISFAEFNQLVLRTSGKVFLDYNPSDTEHWIYDLLNQDQKAILIKSTYLDNPFLTEDQVQYIQNLINVDENYYKVYALGERPVAQTRIYSHFKQYGEVNEVDDWCYGLDFGYNHPTALVKCQFKDRRVYIEEELYKTGLTVDELIAIVKEKVQPGKYVWCDAARPDIIEGLRRVGIWAKPAQKAVKEGINEVKSREIYVHTNSTNIWREYKLYSWKAYKEQILDEPVKAEDDAMDAIRYAIYSDKNEKPDKRYVGFFTPKK